MSGWTQRGATAPFHFEAPHGLWQIAPTAHSGQVELGYAGFDAQGRLPGIPLAVGTLSSTAEAMLAVALYEQGPVSGPVRDMVEAEGFQGRDPEWRLSLGQSASIVLRLLPEAVVLTYEAGGREHPVGCLNRPRSEGAIVLFPRPPGHEDPEATDVAILLQVARLRRARGTSGVGEPVTMRELRRWAETGDRRSGRREVSGTPWSEKHGGERASARTVRRSWPALTGGHDGQAAIHTRRGFRH